MFSKYNSQCAETGTKIKRNDLIIYDPITKKSYSIYAHEAKKRYDFECERRSIIDYVDAQESAMYERY